MPGLWQLRRTGITIFDPPVQSLAHNTGARAINSFGYSGTIVNILIEVHICGKGRECTHARPIRWRRKPFPWFCKSFTGTTRQWKTLVPFLGIVLATDTTHAEWEQQFSNMEHAFLQDHRVGKVPN